MFQYITVRLLHNLIIYKSIRQYLTVYQLYLNKKNTRITCVPYVIFITYLNTITTAVYIIKLSISYLLNNMLLSLPKIQITLTYIADDIIVCMNITQNY